MTILTLIAGYMKVYRKRYAFLTTYDETVFLKQEQKEDGNWVLWHSNPILHLTESKAADPDDYKSCYDCVSLRECFLYILALSCDAENFADS